MKSDHLAEGQIQAEDAFRAGKFNNSNSTLMSLIESQGETSYRCFCIGRNFRYMGNLVEAKSWLLKALAFQKYYPWSLYELALAEEKEGNLVEAGDCVIRFLESADAVDKPRQYNSTHKVTILRIAHALFTSNRTQSIGIYSKAQAHGVEDYRSALRLIESRVDSDSPDKVFADMTALRGKYTLDSWGLLTLSRLHQRRNEIAEARQALIVGLDGYPNNFSILALTCHRMIEMALYDDVEGLIDRLRIRVQDLGRPEKARATGIELRLAVRKHDCGNVARVLADETTQWESVEKWVLVEAMFEFARPRELIQPEELAVIERLHSVIREVFSGTLPEVHALLQYYLRRRMWSEAGELLDGLKKFPAIYTNPEIIIRRLELHCNAGDMSGAAEIYRTHVEGTELTNWGCGAAIRFLAEQKRWEDAAVTLKQGIRNGYTFPDKEHLMLQIARRSGMREEFLALLDEITITEARHLPVELLNLRQLLIDDLCIGVNNSILETKAGEKHSLSPRNAVLVSQGSEHIKSSDLANTALFLCTDKNYFFSVLTFLASYSMHNQQKVKSFVFLGDDVPKSWTSILKGFAAKIRMDIEVVAEKTFLGSNVSHTESYGIFTGGFSLSRAAYFRIYAARYLQGLLEFQRLCYIDSDIICQGDLLELFTYDMRGCLLAARCEEFSPDVNDAAKKNSLDPHHYFNSGVLLLDVSREETAYFLGRAMQLSESESERLTFHDQCALNIAFESQMTPLPPELNFFLRPHRTDNGDFTSAKLVHFLERPKPWDVSFTREYRDIWTRHAEVVRLLLAPEEYNQLVIQANSGAPITSTGGTERAMDADEESALSEVIFTQRVSSADRKIRVTKKQRRKAR